METSSQVSVRRLNWAGVEIVRDQQRILIDPVENAEPFEHLLGKPRHPLEPVPDFTGATVTLVTHLHRDHCDRRLLKRLDDRGGRLITHRSIAPELSSIGLAVEPADLWNTQKIGQFRVTPIPAGDWRGDDQVSWIVEIDGHTYFHGGDTIWHGYWWRAAQTFGPFDLAFLPVNGVLVEFPGYTPSGIPATLTPSEAAVATRLLNAKQLVPIHYGTFNNPPVYVEQSNIAEQLAAAAEREKVQVNWVRENDLIRH